MGGNIFFVSRRYVFLILSLTQFLVHGQRSAAMASMLATAQLKKQFQCQIASQRLIDDVMQYANAHELATPVLQQLQESLADKKKITDLKSFYNGLREFSAVVARMHKLPEESCYEIFEQEAKKAIGKFSEQFKLAIEQQGTTGVDAVPTQLKTLESLMNQAATNAITLAMPTKRDLDLNGNDEDMLGGTRAPSDSAFIAGTGAAGSGLTIDKLGLIYASNLKINSDVDNNTGATTIGNATLGGIVTIDSSVVTGTDTGIKIGNSVISTAVNRTIAIGTTELSGAVVATQNIDIGNGTMAGDAANLKTITVDIGSNTIEGTAAHVNMITIGDSALNGAGAYNLDASIMNGNVAAVACTADRDIKIGNGTNASTGINSLDIAIGSNNVTGAGTFTHNVLIADGDLSGGTHVQTVKVADGDIAGAAIVTNEVDIASGTIGGTVAHNLDVNILNGTVGAGAVATTADRDINIASGTNSSTGVNSLDVNVASGDFAGTGVFTENVKVANGAMSGAAAHVLAVDIASGALSAAAIPANRDITIGNGSNASTVVNTFDINIGSGIINGTGACTYNVNIASGALSGAEHQQVVNVANGTLAGGADNTVNIASGVNSSAVANAVNVAIANGAIDAGAVVHTLAVNMASGAVSGVDVDADVDISIGNGAISATAVCNRDVNIASGALSGAEHQQTVNIANSSLAGGSDNTTSIASGAITGTTALANLVYLGNSTISAEAGAKTITVEVANGTNAGTAASPMTVSIASGIKTATTASPTIVNIGSGDSSGAGHQETINIGAGTINHADVDKIVNIATGTNTLGARTVNVGVAANTVVTTNIHGATNINQDASDVGTTAIGNTTAGVVNVATLSTSASTYQQANGAYAAPSNTFSSGTSTGSYYYPDTTRKAAAVFSAKTDTFNVSQGPAVTFMNNGTFAVIYTQIGPPVATYFQRYNADYTTLGLAVQVDTGNLAAGTGAAAIAYDTSRDYIIVAWVKANGEVYVSSYKASDGTEVGAALLVSSTYVAAAAAYPSLAIEGDGTIGVFWQRDSDKYIYANNVSTGWAAGATPVAISAAAAETAGNQCAAYLGGTTAVVCWKEVAVTKYLHYNTYDITAGTAGTEGHVQETALDDSDKHGAVAAIRFGNVMFTYKTGASSLHRKVFDNTLATVLVADAELVATAIGDQFAVAADGISFMVAYATDATTGNYLKVANYDATATLIGTAQDVLATPAASINDASRPALALCGGDCVASWYRYHATVPVAVDAQAFSLKGYGVSTIGGRSVRTSTIGAAGAIKNTTDIYGTLNVTGGDIATSGNVYVNGSVNMAAAELSGNLCVHGNIVATGSITGQGTCPSDKRIKTNVQTLDQQKGFDVIKRLRPISYTYTPEFVKRANVKNNNRQLGLIAQEVEELVPEVVSTLSIGGQEIRGISYDRLVPSLICAIQLLQKKVEYLEAKY